MVDKKITLGNVLTIAALVVSLSGAYYSQSLAIETLRSDMIKHDSVIERDVAVLREHVNSLEGDWSRRLERIEEKLDRLIETR